MLPRLEAILGLRVTPNVPLRSLTRFGVGGPAALLADATTETALAEAISALRESGSRWTVIGGGTNLVASDQGFDGVIVRFVGDSIGLEASSAASASSASSGGPDLSEIRVETGAILQDLVDFTIAHGLRGLETMTGIPGWVGGAVYGNAGAYGHSIDERIRTVRFFDGSTIRELDRAACQFRYRESIFKRNKQWIALSTLLELDRADAAELAAKADSILAIRNEKYPPSMLCAGSIFKNLLFADLPTAVQSQVPSRVVREGKVPSAYFLEQAGAKGLEAGGIRVAEYHANLIYNTGAGTATQIRELVGELKRRVEQQFGITLEEEVQYI